MEQSHPMGSNWKDQEALVLSIHGTEVTVLTVRSIWMLPYYLTQISVFLSCSKLT